MQENLLLDVDGNVRICDFGWCAFEAYLSCHNLLVCILCEYILYTYTERERGNTIRRTGGVAREGTWGRGPSAEGPRDAGRRAAKIGAWG